MPGAITYPLMNGVRPDFASIVMNWQGTNIPVPVPIVGFDSFDFSIETNGQLQHGACRTALGQTVGHVSCSANCTMFLKDYYALLGYLALTGGNGVSSGYMTQLFDIMLTYTFGANALIPPFFVNLLGCRIKGDHESHSQGSGDELKVRFDLQPNNILKNGFSPASDYYDLLNGKYTLVLKGA